MSDHAPTPYRYPLAKPDLRGNEYLYVSRAVVAGQLSMGDYVERFEAAFAARLGVKHAIACSSGTAALHLALLAAGVKPGDRVLVPTLTYVATVAAVRYCGAIPVFVEADPETWGMRDDAVWDLATYPSGAWTLPVHLYGVPSRPNADVSYMIEDAAEALGASEHQRPCGTLGRLGVFSFYGNKILTTGEGGCVVTDDDALAAEMRLLRGQGQSPERRYYHTRVGFNYRMTELSAAIGCAQLERLDEMLAVRRTLWARYFTNLYDTAVEHQTPRPGTTAAPWVFACLIPPRVELNYPAFRDQVMRELAQAGIETRPTFPCVHQMPPYREYAQRTGDGSLKAGDPRDDFPIAEDIAARGIVLPLHAQMNVAQVDVICDALRKLL